MNMSLSLYPESRSRNPKEQMAHLIREGSFQFQIQNGPRLRYLDAETSTTDRQTDKKPFTPLIPDLNAIQFVPTPRHYYTSLTNTTTEFNKL